LSLLAAGSLFKLTFFEKMPGGDAGVGYSWAMLILIAAFWVCMALVACVIGFGGGMLGLCFLVLLLGSTLGMEASLGGIRWLAPPNAVATAMVLLVTFAVLLNENLKMIVPPAIVKWELGGVFALNVLMLAGMVFGFFFKSKCFFAFIQQLTRQLPILNF
jgi:hypothetical protein